MFVVWDRVFILMHAFHSKQTSETKDQISLWLRLSTYTAVAWVAWVQSLVGELRYCKSYGMAKTKQTNEKQSTVVLLYGGQELLPGMGTVNASPLHLSLKPSFWLIKRFTRNSVIISGVIIPVLGTARSN